MFNTRFLENIKVRCRKNKAIYFVSKVIYSPIALIFYIRFRYKLHNKIRALENALLQLTPNDKRIFYLGVPTHENLGDAAQMYCIRKWIHENFEDYDLVEIESWPTYNKKIRVLLDRLVTKNNIFVTESGATFSNRHEDHGMHRYILSHFKDNKIILMPETVDLPEKEQMLLTASLFNAHPTAIFLARDPESYKMVQPYFDNNRIFLFPDIVTTLIGNVSFKHNRNGILVCKRIDGEKKFSDIDIKELLSKLTKLQSVDITDTDFDKSIEYTYAHLSEEIMDKINLFAKYKVILTDRYHGMIFSLIANTPVVVLPTTGHKVRFGAKWFKEDYPNSIYFCETLDEAYSKVKDIINDNIELKNPSIYKEKYFDNLKLLIK
jgi:exopolysaccharide biosynthesis predicted pyruvyltransferase EpsI